MCGGTISVYHCRVPESGRAACPYYDEETEQSVPHGLARWDVTSIIRCDSHHGVRSGGKRRRRNMIKDPGHFRTCPMLKENTTVIKVTVNYCPHCRPLYRGKPTPAEVKAVKERAEEELREMAREVMEKTINKIEKLDAEKVNVMVDKEVKKNVREMIEKKAEANWTLVKKTDWKLLQYNRLDGAGFFVAKDLTLKSAK